MVPDKKWAVFLILNMLAAIGIFFQLATIQANFFCYVRTVGETWRLWRNLPLQYPATEFANETELLALSKLYTAKYPQQLLVILLWTKLFYREDWALGSELGQAPFVKLGCPVSNCYVTNNRVFLNNASAVLVNFRTDFTYSDRPSERPHNQHWVYFLWESPEYTYHWEWMGSKTSRRYLNDFHGFFNWTMTYRLDSDIPFLYGRFARKTMPEPEAVKRNRLANKSRSVIWIQSNCNTPSRRFEYVQALQRYIDVDVIGTCGGTTHSLNDTLTNNGICKKANIFEPMNQECIDYIRSTYKFYLAAENSLCRDYVTEKFFRAASLDIIPIVFNGANMSYFGPSHSFIDAQDYGTPKELADFLRQVGSNADEYNSYFWWKSYYVAENLWDNYTFTHSFCDLCAKLTRASFEPAKYAKIYGDLNDWWMTKGECYGGFEGYDLD